MVRFIFFKISLLLEIGSAGTHQSIAATVQEKYGPQGYGPEDDSNWQCYLYKIWMRSFYSSAQNPLMAPHYLQDKDVRPPFVFSALGLTNFPSSRFPASPGCSLFLSPPSSIALLCLRCSLCLPYPSTSQELLLILQGSVPSAPSL